MLATRGGKTTPILSEWTISITPMERVVKPQEAYQTIAFSLFWLKKSMLNILAKFWPRLCEVAAWIARPLAGTKASTVVVKSPPANFSFSDLI